MERKNMRNYETIIVLDYYLPGRLAGGPVTTLANLMTRLGDRINALIVTRNNDIDGSVYSEVEPWEIQEIDGANVLYLPDTDFNANTLAKIIDFFSAKMVYFNSFFSPITISYLFLNCPPFKRNDIRVLVAPRGEFSMGALGLKARKKAAYLTLFKVLRMGRLIQVFQASSKMEKEDIQRALGLVHVVVAPDVSAPVETGEPQVGEEAKLVFLSRISPMKNLLGALEILAQVTMPCCLDIYGPKEDPAYWQQCETRISALPSHIKVAYCGSVAHSEVGDILRTYSGLLLPTFGENFGHVIFEALSAGCPPIISDQTPWVDLEKREVGWICSLTNPLCFVEAIEQVLQDPLMVRYERARRCMAYARAVSENSEVLEANLKLFSISEALGDC